MPCMSPDGAPIDSGEILLTAVKAGFITPENIAKQTGLAMWRVRASLRELVLAGFASQSDETFAVTPSGIAQLANAKK